jgi:surfeit locus 1 family protein
MLKTDETRMRRTPGLPHLGLPSPRTLFSHQWWWATLVVLLGMAFLARLGIWQLDRLEQRKAHNAQIIQQLGLPPLPLTVETLPDDLSTMKYRRASASGEFDFSHQVVLLYQNWMNTPGVHLITPLVLEDGSRAVLVDRGWIPNDQAAPENWSQFDNPGPAHVNGFVQLSQVVPSHSRKTTQEIATGPQSEWYRVDIEAIQDQMPYQLLPVYILQSPPETEDTLLPYQVEPEFDLSNGSHLSYAIQWFSFAAILGIIYLRYVGKKEAGGSAADDSSDPYATQ